MFEYAEVSEIVNSMHNDFEELRETARNRYDLYRMKKEPYVPDEIAREGKVRMLSPLVIYAAETIRADIMMNPTEFTVVPLAREKDGRVLASSVTKAENLERSLAVLWGRLNEGRRLDREIVWHQLVSPFGVMMLEFNSYELPEQPEDMDDELYANMIEEYEETWIPWSVYLPDPLTCSWVERNGKPVIFARKYKILVRDLEEAYKFNKTSSYPDKKLVYDEGYFKWVSDDYQVNSSNAKAGFKEVEVLWLDDGKNIYQCVHNPGQGDDKDSGIMLACAPNPTGKPTAFVIPGNTTPDREMNFRYEPFLLPLMQSVNKINDLRSMRATAARNLAGPHHYVPIDPEIQKIYLQKGEKLPTEVRWKKNVTHYLLGKVEILPSELSEDYDKIEALEQAELERYLPSPFVNIVDPEILKTATATSILHAAEAGLRMYGPLMAAYDSAIRDMCESMITSIRTYYKEESISLYGSGEEVAHGRNLKEGSRSRLNLDAVKFPYKLIVRTRNMSKSQAQAQYETVLAQRVLPDGTHGPAVLEDLISAANFTDIAEQKMKIAKEEIMFAIKPWIQQMAMEQARKKILADSGIDIPMMPMMGAQQQPSSMPNNAQRMEAPMITGAEGGTSGTA